MAKTTSRTHFADLVHWALLQLPSAMCTGNLASWWKYNCKLKQNDERRERGMIERGAQRGFIEISARTDRLHSDAHNPAFVSSSLYWIHLWGLDESNMAMFVHTSCCPAANSSLQPQQHQSSHLKTHTGCLFRALRPFSCDNLIRHIRWSLRHSCNGLWKQIHLILLICLCWSFISSCILQQMSGLHSLLDTVAQPLNHSRSFYLLSASVSSCCFSEVCCVIGKRC